MDEWDELRGRVALTTVRELRAMIEEEELGGQWSAETANQRCEKYADAVGLLLSLISYEVIKQQEGDNK